MKLVKYISWLCLWMFFACGDTNVKSQEHLYTCSMHPQIVKNDLGSCPICHMDLVEITPKDTKVTNHSELHLTDEQIKLANIQVDTLMNGSVQNKWLFTGALGLDESKVWVESAKVGGRVEKLYVKTQWAFVNKGAPIFEIYSEELNTVKKEYQMLSQQLEAPLNGTLETVKMLQMATKHKLELWGMSAQQIKDLETDKEIALKTVYYSAQSGYVRQLNVEEGAYIMEGGAVMEMAQIETLWAEAQVYTSQLSKIQMNDIAVVRIPELQGLEIRGKISFENPEILNNARLNSLRVVIHNPNQALRVGMPVYIEIQKPAKKALILPSNALIRNGNGTTVWIQISKGVFKNVSVQTGLETDFEVVITDGLQTGDQVVIAGAYLLNSEYVFQNGADPMAGMHLDVEEVIHPSKKYAVEIVTLMKLYVQIQKSLSADNPESSFAQANQMKVYLQKHQNSTAFISVGKKLLLALDQFSRYDLQAQRDGFKIVSVQIYSLLKSHGTHQTWYKQYCPMANAYWLSEQKTILNPYYGDKMLTCGEIQETIR